MTTSIYLNHQQTFNTASFVLFLYPIVWLVVQVLTALHVSVISTTSQLTGNVKYVRMHYQIVFNVVLIHRLDSTTVLCVKVMNISLTLSINAKNVQMSWLTVHCVKMILTVTLVSATMSLIPSRKTANYVRLNIAAVSNVTTMNALFVTQTQD